jgi:hypothetical protein
MTKWELKTFYTTRLLVKQNQAWVVDPTVLWTVNDENYGRPDMDILKEYASEGWELVTVTPIISNSYTSRLLYTFKRPIE